MQTNESQVAAEKAGTAAQEHGGVSRSLMPSGPFRRPGGHCSQKLLLRRGSHSSPGCSRSSHQYEINNSSAKAGCPQPVGSLHQNSVRKSLLIFGNRYGRQGGSNSVYTSLSGALVAAGRKSESQRSFRTHLKSASNPTPNLGPSRNSLGQAPPRVIKYPKCGDSLTTDMLSPAVTTSPTKKNQPP